MLLDFRHFIDSFLDNSCCAIGCAAIDNLEEREKIYFKNYMPAARSVIALGHHIIKKAEWKWYTANDGHERCDADDHAREVCYQIKEKIESQGFLTKIVPYPEESGLQFRFVAQSAGLGNIGKNAFLLHPEWGPWIHLRVIVSEASFESPTHSVSSICTECLKCMEACPANAITDITFNGLTCRSYRKSKGEYKPCGPKGELKYCEICAQVCPIGDKPK